MSSNTNIRTRIILGLTSAVVLALSRATAADSYKIDPAHTSLNFSIRHMGVSNVKGHFDAFAGSLVLDHGSIKEASGMVQVKSVNTGMERRDSHLRSPDFFDVAKYPEIRFKTKRVEQRGERTVLIADFTMRGVTKEMRLPVTLSGPIKDPQGTTRIGLEGRTTLNRKDYGIQFNGVMETGGLMLGEEVAIEIDAEATKQGPATAENQ